MKTPSSHNMPPHTIDLTEEPEAPYKSIEEVSDDESDIEYFYDHVYGALQREKELNILATKETIEKEDEESKKLNDDINDDVEFEEEGDEDDLNNAALAKSLNHRLKYKPKNKSSFIIDKSITIDPEDVSQLPEDLEPLTNREKQGLLMKNFSSAQATRYEAYKRATLSKPFFKKISMAVIGSNLTGPSQYAVSGLARYFMFELLEKCRDVYELDQKVEIGERIARKREMKFEESKRSGKRIKGSSLPDIRAESNRPTPLQPYHVREAFRLYKMEKSYPTNNIRQQGDGNGWRYR